LTSVAIVGTTRWGTTLAIVLGRKGVPVRIWARTPREAQFINRVRENPLVPGFPLPDSVAVTASAGEAVAGAALVIFAVPSQTLRANLNAVKKHLTPGQLLVSAAKGLEEATACRMSQVMAAELDPRLHEGIAVLSGPNLSGEILRGLPAATVVAAREEAVAREAQRLLGGSYLRAEVTTDVVGVEMGGALKNIIAIGAGLADGVGSGENAKAVLVTRGLGDMVRLAVACGGREETLLGLAGLGDLLATGFSPLSRNHFVGQQLARGCSLAEVLAGQQGVCEGVPTARAAWRLSQEVGVEVPVFRYIYQLLFEGLPPQQVAAVLLGTSAELAPSR